MQTIFGFDLELQSEISRVPKHSSDVIAYSAKPNLTLSDSRFISEHFSNSLIIHEEKTKEITTVKEVWICDPNYHKIQ